MNPQFIAVKGRSRPSSLARKLYLSAAVLAMPLLSLQAATYYVDSVSGLDGSLGTTDTTPWQTLTKVNSVTFQPGDTIRFKRGSVWTGRLQPLGTGSTAGRITFKDYGDAAAAPPTIQGANFEPAVRLYSKSYFTFENFKITNPGAAEGPRDGIRLIFTGNNGASNTYRDVIIRNNEITNVTGLTNRDAGNNYSVGAIYVEFSDYQASRNKVDGLLIEGNYIHDTKCLSIQFKPAGNYNPASSAPADVAAARELWADNVVIRDNVMSRTGGDHILVQGCDGPLIEYNGGYEAGLNAVNDGNLWQAGMWVCYHTRNSVFQYNEVARTVNHLINNGDSQAFDVDFGTHDSHVFQYNYTHDNAGGVLIMMPREKRDPDTAPNLVKTVVFRYNVSINDGRNTLSQSQFGISPRAGVNSANIHNNVFYTNRPEGLRIADVEGSYFTNNIFYTPAGIYPKKPTFSNNAYFGHTPVVEDPYKITANPLLTGPFPTGTAPDAIIAGLDMRTLNNPYKLLSTSPLINRGKPVTLNVVAPTLDFWGNALYSGNVDIGAHEVAGGSNSLPTAVYYTDNTDSSAVYTGTWTHMVDVNSYDGTRSQSSTVGNYAQITFSGTNIVLYGKKGPDMGRIAISLDGGVTTAATVNCYSATHEYRAKLYETSGLPNNPNNTLRATVVARLSPSTGDNVAIDYIVRDGGAGTVQPADPITIAMDTESSGVTFLPNAAAWTTSRAQPGYYGTNYMHDGNTGATVAKSVRYTPTLPVAATYKVYARWAMYSSYASNATYTVNYGTGQSAAFSMNQRANPDGWILLGAFPFPAGTSGNVTLSNTGANGHVIADGVMFVAPAPVAALPVTVDNPAISNLPSHSVSYAAVTGSWNHATGDATFYNGTKSVSDGVGNSVEFKFTGTRASLYVKKASNLGKLEISLNGTVVATEDCYSPTTINQFKLYETALLPNQLHTLKATIRFKNGSSSGNYVGIDKFIYQP